MIKEITIPYKRRERAKNADANEKRWNVLVLHRRAGKSTHRINKMIKNAIKKQPNPFPDWVHAYIAPTYKQAKSIIWEQAKYYANYIPWVSINEWELKIVFPNNHVLRLFGADYPDSLRWLKFREVTFDEYAQQPSNIFSEIIRPWLTDTKWWATWIWTPKGKNAFYDIWKLADHQMKLGKDRYTMTLKASESKLIEREELEDSRTMMTEDEYNQEYECSREASIKWAYYSQHLNKVYKENRVVKSLYDKLLPVYTARDLWRTDYTAVVFYQLHGNEIRVIDCYKNQKQSLDFFFSVIRDRWYNYAFHRLPHDAKAKSRQTGMSDEELFQRAFGTEKVGIAPMLRIMEWINAVRYVFDKIWFDEDKTEDLRQSLSNYRQERDDKRWVFKEEPFHDRSSHFSDAFRYMAVSIRRVQESVNKYEALTPDFSKYV